MTTSFFYVEESLIDDDTGLSSMCLVFRIKMGAIIMQNHAIKVQNYRRKLLYIVTNLL